jgi:diguanylate cyclase (GGDEF)-like protein/PAS domain S-box-containing protein
MSQEQSRRKVLVVDDEPQVLAAIEDTLEEDFQVLVHTSPQLAMRTVENEPNLSVILSDQRMPAMNGDDFLARASAISDASRMMITGYADIEAVIRAVNKGNIFGYISKPWDPEALRLAIFKAAEHHRLLRELSEEQRFLRNLMDNIPDAIFFKDREHRFLRLNQVHARYLGVERPEDPVGRTADDFCPADEARQRRLEDEEVMRTGKPMADKVRRMTLPGGGFRWSSTTKAAIKDEKGAVTSLVGIVRDVTERQLAEEKVRRLNRVYAMLSAINALIVRAPNREELYREACRIATEAGGFPFAWIGTVENGAILPVASHGIDQGFLATIGTRLSLIPGDSQEVTIAAQAVVGGKAVVSNDVQSDPRVVFKQALAERGIQSLAAFPLVVSESVVAVLVLHVAERGFFDDEEMRLLTNLAGDISFALEHIEKTERLNYLAYYDSLTGLQNRSLFAEQAGLACTAAAYGNAMLAVAVLDIERFRTINDTLGRQAGDALLKQIAGRMGEHAAETARVARIGADQFAILIPDVQGEDELARRTEQRMREIFGPPYRIGETELRIAAKQGIAVFPGDGADADTLLGNAEAALKRAKATGERYLFYAQEMTERVGEHLKMENRLRQALERDEFVLHYQPKIDLESRRIVGMEALIRWMTPDGQLVPPMKFIPLLEETGLILDVGAWAMRRAATDYRDLARQGIVVPRIAVNVSSVQLRRRDFVDTVKRAIDHESSPAGIDLEVTESLIMADMAGNIAKLRALRELGMEIAIDDFGTGYSSLAYLANLPVQALKIDRSFVITMLENPNTMTLVSTIISLAHSLKLKVIAEGVDSEDQAKMLRLLHCDQMQGYLFSKPLAFPQIAALLKG